MERTEEYKKGYEYGREETLQRMQTALAKEQASKGPLDWDELGTLGKRELMHVAKQRMILMGMYNR